MPIPCEVSRKSYVPNIAEEEICARAERIMPVMHVSKKGMFLNIWSIQKPEDIFHDNFTWYPKLGERVEKMRDLDVLTDIRTYHRFGPRGSFAPKVAEVLAQIPEVHLSKVVAFEVVAAPNSDEDWGWDQFAFEAGYHVATVRLYFKDPFRGV